MSDVGDVRMRLLRSSELDERGEMDSCLFRPSLADVRGLNVPEPIGEGNSSPSSDNAELGSVNSCETDVGVPLMFGKSGEISPPKLRFRPLLVLAPEWSCLSAETETPPGPAVADCPLTPPLAAMELDRSGSVCCLLL